MINRRHFLEYSAGFAGSMLLPARLLAQSGIRLQKLNFFEIRVSDTGRSIAFLQDLFGLPVQSRHEDRTFLKIGDFNEYVAVRPVRGGESPAITHYGYAVANYDPDGTLAALKASGFGEIDPPDITTPGIENPMTVWVRDRAGTPTIYFSDARGLIVQLTDPSWCAGSGPLGNVCGSPEPVATGSIPLSEINHFTAFVNGGPEAAEFY